VALAALALGCGSNEPVTLGEQAELDAGGVRVVAQTQPLQIELWRGDDLLLRFERSGFQLGVVGSVSDDENYDPYRLYVPHPLYTPPADLQWLAVADERIAEQPDGSLLVTLDYPEGQQAELHLQGDAFGRIALSWTPSGGRTAYFRLVPEVDEQEGFYGLGEVLDSVNHRGKVRAMQMELDTVNEAASNEAHVPIPLLLGTRGWGMFVPCPYAGAFAVAHEQADRVEATFGTGPASADGLDVYLFGEEHPLDLTRHYYELTGFPGLPARWALGPWVWRDENEDQAQVVSDLETIRDLDLATTAYWIDRPYATAVNTFDFEPSQFPDPPAMVQTMHDLGFRTALWHTPYLDEEHPSTEALRDHAEANGFYPLEAGLTLNHWGTILDLSNPDARQWWQELLAYYIDLGIEGFKLDYAEDIVVGATLSRMRWQFADGSDERTMQSQYQRYYHQTYRELLDESGTFLLCRAGTYGDQQNGTIIWPGDLDSNFAKHYEDREDGGESYVAVGGLPASVIAGLSLGPSGFPFYGADTGGYRHCPPDKETFTRWFEQTALSSVMQVGTSCNDVAWEFSAETGFDQEMLDWYRQYVRLHLRLFPYLWSYANRLLTDGRPLQRALGLAHPELGVHPDDVYLLGDELLVAPVVERDARERIVPLPDGTWVHWFTGRTVEGAGQVAQSAPLGSLPLYLRAGGIVPLLRPTIDTLSPTAEPTRVDSYATDPGVLYARAVYGHAGSFELFDGSTIEISVQGADLQIVVADGSEFDAGAVIELMTAGRPSTVTRDGQPLPEATDLAALEPATEGWTHTAPRAGTLWIKLPPGGATAVVSP
jgi:alpha-D-xyloside xylohydrolase